jgi:hypothetical protein
MHPDLWVLEDGPYIPKDELVLSWTPLTLTLSHSLTTITSLYHSPAIAAPPSSFMAHVSIEGLCWKVQFPNHTTHVRHSRSTRYASQFNLKALSPARTLSSHGRPELF